MNIAINIICVYLAREKVIKSIYFVGIKPTGERIRRQNTAGSRAHQDSRTCGQRRRVVSVICISLSKSAPSRALIDILQNAVKKLRQLRDIAARGQFALRLPLLQKLG